MITIYKFPLKVTDSQKICITHGAKILCVQTQNNIPCLWVLMDTEEHPIFLDVTTIGTGHDAENVLPDSYIGTYQLEGGALVFHVFIQ